MYWRTIEFGAPAAKGKVRRRPQHVLETVHESGNSHLGWIFDTRVHIIALAVHLDQLYIGVGADLCEVRSQPLDGITLEHLPAVFRHKVQIDVHLRISVRIIRNPVTL